MAIPFASAIDLLLNEIQNGTFQALASDPGSPIARQFWYNTTANEFRYYDGTVVHRISAVYLLARANHTGTQLASTISDFDTQVRTSTLNQLAAPTADVSLASHKLTNVTDPSGAQDAATKAYVDAYVNGLQWKQSVRASTTGNITLSGAQTIDGVSVVAGDRVLVKAQTTGSENGIWVAAAGAWARASDADSGAEVKSGLAVIVDEGTANDNTAWVLSTADPITVGTTALSFVQLSGGGTSYTAGTGLQLVGTAFSRDPTYVDTVAQGGTNSSTAAGARASLSAATVYAADVGDGSSTSFNVDHNFGTLDVSVTVRETSGSYREVFADVTYPTVNRVTVAFATAPASGAYRVIVLGLG